VGEKGVTGGGGQEGAGGGDEGSVLGLDEFVQWVAVGMKQEEEEVFDHCNTLQTLCQCTATYCNILQHTATHPRPVRAVGGYGVKTEEEEMWFVSA